MTKWTYKLERFDLMAKQGYKSVEAVLNSEGAVGWELVGIQDVGQHPYVIYKRPG